MSRFLVEDVAVSKVIVGARRRQVLGSLAGLKSSMESVGQIHPITLRMTEAGLELVAGERRLASARALGWTKIRARIGKFSDDQLRQIELEENTCRLDLTPAEASAARLRSLERDAEEVNRQNDLTKPRKPGRTPGPAAVLSGGDKKRQGAIRDQMHRDRKHVAAAEQHPVFQGPQWRQSHVRL